jgi:phospholipid/cholesterol/gamma-HCH transport system substrate-binding protein
MSSYNRMIGVGLFVLGGALLFAVGLFMVGSRRMLFTNRFDVRADFGKISGLQKGAKVRVAGMDAGEIFDIEAPASPSGKFRVIMRVREDLHQLVRVDSLATIQTDGLVGNKFIQIEAGSAASPRAPVGSVIRAQDPYELADLILQANTTIKTLDATVTQLRGDLQEALGSITDAANEATKLITDLGVDVRAIAANGTKISKDVQLMTANVRAGKGTVGKLMNDEELYQRLATITKDAQQIATQVRETVAEARQTMAGLNKTVNSKDGGVQGMSTDLRQTMTYAREAMADLAENTESLKRNFLFRGLFKERGFFDLGSVSAEAYRGGEFAGKGRVPLRIWLDAAVLFATGADGVETLSDTGRQRLDAAMATLLRYPKKHTPLMIEGYADGASQDAQVLVSQTRAALVRDYLLSRFALDPNTTGIVALGAEAENSPRGDGQWSGVGLALWLPKAAFRAANTRTQAQPPQTKAQASQAR